MQKKFWFSLTKFIKMSNCTAAKEGITNDDLISKNFFMKKINNKKEPWFKWLTRELNSCEVFKDFDSGKNPVDVAEDFISNNKIAIAEVFENFDEEDKETLDQFLKLTECEWHVFRILGKKIALKNKIIFVDFKKEKNK